MKGRKREMKKRLQMSQLMSAPPASSWAPLAVTVFQAPQGSLVRVLYILNKMIFQTNVCKMGPRILMLLYE